MADEAKDWVEARAEELRERSSELLRGEPVSENDAHLAAQRADVAHQHAAEPPTCTTKPLGFTTERPNSMTTQRMLASATPTSTAPPPNDIVKPPSLTDLRAKSIVMLPLPTSSGSDRRPEGQR